MERLRIKYLVKPNGRAPFESWLKSIDTSSRAYVIRAIQKVQNGKSPYSIKFLKDEVYEIKISQSPGFRVYFVQTDQNEITLITGGDKGSQSRDIVKAIKLWRQHGQQT